MDRRAIEVVFTNAVMTSMEHVTAADRAEVQAQVDGVAHRMSALPAVLRPPDLFEQDWIHLGILAGSHTAVCEVDAARSTLTVVELLRHA